MRLANVGLVFHLVGDYVWLLFLWTGTKPEYAWSYIFVPFQIVAYFFMIVAYRRRFRVQKKGELAW